MSKPDFDGVYRTQPSEGVFGRKKRPDDTRQVTRQLPRTTPQKSTTPQARKGVTPQPATPKSPFRGDLGGCEVFCGVNPTPVTPMPGSCRVSAGKRQRKEKKPPFVIIEDTREQTPLREWPEGAAVVEKGLDTGDYSIEGWEHCFAVERKSLADFAGTMIGGFEPNTQKPRKRFNNELERLRHFDCAAVVVIASPKELIEFKHHCGMDAHGALWNFALSVFATYGIPVFALTDEKTAAKWIYDLARHYIAVRTKKNRSQEDRAKKIAADWKF